MPFLLQDVIDRRASGIGSAAILEDEVPSDFPLARWSLQSQKYYQYWNLFTGELWNERTEVKKKDGEVVQSTLRYPLQLNFAKTICMKHNYVLWGEVLDNPEPMAPVIVRPRPSPGLDETDEEAKIMADELEDFVNRVWMDNNGRNLQQEAGLIQQFLGGIVFRVGWQPDDLDLEFGIRLEVILPDFFMPVWDSGKPDQLLEAWVVWRIPIREAKLRFGVNFSDTRDPLYVEHWTRDEVHITIGNIPVTMDTPDGPISYDRALNPFGFVPFVYIPRERAGGYYGLSILDDTEGMMKELNARYADMGDIIYEASHRQIFVKNMSGSPKTVDIGGTRPAVNLGNPAPGGNEPDIMVVDPVALPESVANHPANLRDQLMRDSFVPAVAEGEDEGSQRSALTLAFRMWPITSKTRAARGYWTTGLTLIGKMIGRIAAIKGIGGITLKHLTKVDWAVDWAPMMPRDREADLNEIIMSYQSEMISPTTGMRLLGRVEDPEAEYKRVQEHTEWLGMVQMKIEKEKAALSSNSKQ